MRQLKSLTILLLLSLVVPLVALADSFNVVPADLELGKTATLQFTLENATPYYGFQAEVKLPDGLTAVKKGTDGTLDFSLSSRADEGKYELNSNTLSNGNLIIGAFSGNHTAFTENDGVLVNLNVEVSKTFEGGNIEISKIYFINADNQDVDNVTTIPTFLGVAVTGITFRRSALTLKVDETTTLVPTITPEAATNKKVTWSSSDTTVATVSEDGLVTAIKEGSAIITAKTSNGKEVTCTVKVETNVISVTGISISPTTLELTEGETMKVAATVTPNDATDPSVHWDSSNTDVATVDEEGNVTAKNAGTAKITAEASNGMTATCTVTVKAKVIEVTGVTLAPTTLSLTEGETKTLTATVAPENASDKTVTWSTSDATIATVKDGVVTAVKAGTATITATSNNGKTATCMVTVAAKTIAVTGVTLAPTTLTLNEGETGTITATVAPEDATDKTVTWTTSDASVATVDGNGKVTAVAAGKATITATASGKTATCAVTVNAKSIAVESISFNRTAVTITEGKTLTLSVNFNPTNATDKKVTWLSSNEAVATVNNGVITAVAEGTANITATSSNGKTATCAVTVEKDRSETTAGDVKMTYVNMDDPDKSYGEIPAGETAQAGYNKISNGTVGFVNTGWEVNNITYLQVKVPSVQGNITGATLSFEASGSTDGKRTTGWGVGYNSSLWSADMTYNTADKSITTMGDVKWTTTKSATTFEKFSFDITEAIENADENGYVTILVYETAAAGGYIKNPTATFNWTSEPTYNVTFTETSGVEGVTVTVNGKDVTKGVALINGTYNYTATAKGYKDYEGEFKVNGADLDVKFAMTPKATWNYTIKNNVNGEVKTGTCLEGESANVPYSRYILAANGTVWMKAPCGGDKKLEYRYTFTPDADNYVETLEYTATDMTDGIAFLEAEKIEGMTPTANGNAGVRASDCLGGFAADPVAFYTLKPGTYVIKIAASGFKDKVLTVKAGEESKLTATTSGSWNEFTSDEFTVTANTDLTFEGAADDYPLDYILITGTVGTPVSAITLDKETIEIAKGAEAQLTATVAPENAFVKDLTWSSSDEKVATVDQTGKVKAIEGGSAVITVASAAYPEIKAECKVTVTIPVSGLAIWDEDDNVLDGTHSLALHTGDEYTLTEVVSPENATEQRVTWTSSNEAVAKIVDIVEEPHQVHIDAIAAGEATITASLAGFSTSFKVTVSDPVVPVTGIKLDKTTAEMKTGESLPLTATISPDDASSKEVKWTSSDNTTATVSAKGVVKALKAGKVTITATANKLTATCEITITDIEVADITLDKTEANLTKGETVELTATVTPTNATNPTVAWSSSNEKVATVDQTGKVTAVGGGEAVITAKAGDKTATCKVTVTVPVSGLAILDEDDNVLDSTHSLALHTGDEYTLTEVVSPEDATEQRVIWTSSNEAVAKIVDIVEEPHQVHIDAIAAGEATITASLAGHTTSFKVTVTDPVIPVTGIKLDKTTADMKTGETLELKATISPEDASSKEVKWTSSDNTIATVSAKGVVKALKAGKVTITATANKLTATCEITITDPVVEVAEITLDKTEATITIGGTVELKATVTPENATDATVTWTSSDVFIATVDEFGTVTGIAEGTVVITAKAGDKTAECTVTVNRTSAVELIGLDPEAPVKVFDLNGIYVGETMEGLQQGTYIVRQGNVAKKVRVR
ncbi:MAG: Ig-like domain-containing protein [Muribaculaceae bacterium]|nr:Ig-like domain-containing protein [Muribaculaceae bacterium]